MLKLVAVALAFLSSSMCWAQSDWIRVGETDDTTWEVRPGSLEVSRTKGQVPIVVVVGRTSNLSSKQVTLNKWYVAIKDCEREMGKVVTLDLDGNYRFESDFVFGGGNVATGMAEAICGAYAFRVKTQTQKGL